jgi:hypothetical protein
VSCGQAATSSQEEEERESKVTAPNQVVYADLMFPSKNNGTRYSAILVIMDGYSRYLTAYLLTKKDASTVNPLIMNYINWAERQAGRNVKKIIHRQWEIVEGAPRLPVQIVLTDKGGEFVNREIDDWYKARGIEHVKVGPKSSHLNPVERQHQSLGDMTMTLLRASGLPASFWVDALLYAVYIKNRVYKRVVGCTPFELYFGIKPDIHHLRTFGAMVFVHVPKDADRPRGRENAKIGFLLGLSDDQVGYKVYYPSENTRKWVPDVEIDESIVYGDRYKHQVAEVTFVNAEPVDDEQDVVSDAIPPVVREDDGTTGVDASVTGDAVTMMFETGDGDDPDRPDDDDEGNENEDMTDSLWHERMAHRLPTQSWSDALPGDCYIKDRAKPSTDGCHDDQSHLPTHKDDDEEDGCASLVEDASRSNDVTQDAVDQASTSAPSYISLPSTSELWDEDDRGLPDKDSLEGDSLATKRASIERAVAEARKRQQCSETPSVREAAMPEKRPRRTGLREPSVLRKPNRFKDFMACVANVRILDANGKPILASDVKMPRSHREAMRSKHAECWARAEIEEMGALYAKQVLEEIARKDVPPGAKPIRTMWVWDLKTDQFGYVTRFKARLVALGNWQRAGIDFGETFSPVARMSSFRMVLAVAAVLGLKVFGGDINTAYLNARLKIPQYVNAIEGFPCKDKDNIYVVRKALYGLRQAGRE